LPKKSREKSFRQKGYHCVQKFQAITFWVIYLAFFFQLIRNQHQNLRFLIPNLIFAPKLFLLPIYALFGSFEAKRARNDSQQQKRFDKSVFRITF
jgi:hypothetical protein